MSSPLHAPGLHESAWRHVSGEARYIDDLQRAHGELVARVFTSTEAHAGIESLDVDAARAIPGVHAVLTAADVPGELTIGPIVHDEPLLADGSVHCVGQHVALVIAEDAATCRASCAAIEATYAPRPPILGVREALAANAFVTTPHVIARGDLDAGFAAAAHVVTAELSCGGQDHFYLETQAALAFPEEDGTLRVLSSTQHPSEVQAATARVLGVGRNRVVVETVRMGGAFGGKESQATQIAALAALGARATGRPVRLWLDRDQDMTQTGGRHPLLAAYRVGFDAEGRILAFEANIWTDGGWTADLSGPVLDRAMFHLDGAYHIPALRFEGRACRTNVRSNTAFRGFGGPQGALVIEDAIARLCERTGLDPVEVKRRNLYGDAPRHLAPYGQEIVHNRSPRIHAALLASSDLAARRAEIESFNLRSPWLKRGIALHHVKFGISFTASLLNQAGALLLVYADGTVQLNHGGTEMGQGLHTKMLAICAHELGVSPDAVRVMPTATDKVPNTSATAASSGSDLNGQAVVAACAQVRERLAGVAAELLGARAEELVFAGGQVAGPDGASVAFAAVAEAAWARQISLAASGFYATPGIGYDRDAGQGRPFFYFAFGAAVCEVEVCGLTGQHRVVRVDILHDVGDSLIPTIDRGQVEGGFVQGMGWLTSEELVFASDGALLTHGPSTYKIPSAGDAPVDFRVELLPDAPADGVVHGSKAVGEPPFLLAIAVPHALRHAIAAFGPGGREIELALPATPESVLRAVEAARSV